MMKPWRWLGALASSALIAACVQAQPGKEYTPEVGQQGKDVVWVPTSDALVSKMLDMAKVGPGDIHFDLGSGDGRTVIAAARRGARSYGIEYNPEMVALSRRNAAQAGVADRATFEKADLFETDLSRAGAITLFLLPTINLKLRPKILDLKPGTRIVSNTFTMGEWEPDETATVTGEGGSNYYRTALLWIVPAKVAGTWKSAHGDMTLKQDFQKISGSILSGGGVTTPLTGAKLRGDQIRFFAGGTQYSGKVTGDTISGTATAGSVLRAWHATRVK